ncbi:hypothetical protein AVEN_60877-1 [Araneus ventricosus]|uniref:Uncharacterized protein n=1 Tax=Araneus ventricosus TaxID=182803 RepID=A0A4Y2NAC2_ARAVE|nr:hypothetical protein AVEN_60877-1 [Araneus ventricosus]
MFMKEADLVLQLYVLELGSMGDFFILQADKIGPHRGRVGGKLPSRKDSVPGNSCAHELADTFSGLD